MKKISILFALSIVTLHSVLPVSAYKPGEYPGDPKIQPWNVKRWEKACKYMNKGNELAKTCNFSTYAENKRVWDAYQAAQMLYPWDFRFYANDALYWSKVKEKTKDRHRDLVKLLLEKAVFLCPSEWSNWNALANEYYRRGEIRDAKPLLEQALALDPPKEIAEKLKANIAQINSEVIAGKTNGSGKFNQQVEAQLWAQDEQPVKVGTIKGS